MGGDVQDVQSPPPPPPLHVVVDTSLPPVEGEREGEGMVMIQYEEEGGGVVVGHALGETAEDACTCVDCRRISTNVGGVQEEEEEETEEARLLRLVREGEAAVAAEDVGVDLE